MRIVFMGSPASVVSILQNLLAKSRDHELQLVGVVSQPAKAKARSKAPIDTAVATFAKANGLPLLVPESSKDPAFLASLEELHPDVIVTAAYGQILSEAFLKIPRRATINVHPSMLPEFRGATPVAAALLAGKTETGVSILFTVKKLDAGNIICQETFPIAPDDTCGELTEKLFAKSSDLLFTALKKLKDPSFTGTIQDESFVSSCHKVEKTDGEVDWTLPAQNIYDRYRAFSPWPGSYSFCEGRRILINKMRHSRGASNTNAPGIAVFNKQSNSLEISALHGIIHILELTPAGAKTQNAQSFYNGLKNKERIQFHAKP